MISVALKGVFGRKTRTILTTLAIVLGVGMVSGTFIFTDTVQKAFDSVFASPYKQASVVVSGKEIVAGATTAPTVPASLLARVRAVPGADAVVGNLLFDTVKLVGDDGKAIGQGGPQLGFGVDSGNSRFSPLAVASGKWPHGSDEIAIGSATAAKEHIAVGDMIGAKGEGTVRQYTVTGLVDIPDVSTGRATLAVFDVPTTQSVLHKEGRYDSISVIASSGVSPEQLIARIKPLLNRTETVHSAAAQGDSDSTRVAGDTNLIRYILLAFAGIALFVGAFVIFNTISMTVAQRTREFATLRTLGSSRRQVLRSVLVESAALGAIASVLGLALGFGLAKGIDALFPGLPTGTTVFAPRTVIVSLAVGIAVTLVAGLFPALRATRVPPIAAVREGSTLPPSRFTRFKPYLAGVLIALSIVVIAVGLFSGGGGKAVLAPAAAGTLLLFIGLAMISSRFVGPLVALVGSPARRAGGTAGRLASANSARNPSRTASTAAALMIGLALVTFVAVLASGLESSTRDDLTRQVRSDYVVLAGETSNVAYIDGATASAVRSVPGVSVVSGVRNDKARIFGSATSVSGIDTTTISDVYRFAWKNGSDAVLAHLGAGAIVDSSYAKKHHLSIGSTFAIETSTGTTRTFAVRATYHPRFDPILGGVLIDKAAFDRTFPKPQNIYTFVNTRDGVSPTTTAALTRAVAKFTDVSVKSTPAWIQSEIDTIKPVLKVFYAFLALSVIVSLFGMVNTLVLSVFERTREIGMLRAVGMSRRQVRRMIRHESIITALIGAALGLPLGVFLAAILTRGLSDQGVSFHLPLAQLAYFTLVAVIAGVWAAVLPARRAARLNVLQALQYE